MSSEPTLNFEQASSFLKAMAHDGRFAILCHLASGEKSVSELCQFASLKQSNASLQLARLRWAGFVNRERFGKSVRYRLADERVALMLDVIHQTVIEVEQ